MQCKDKKCGGEVDFKLMNGIMVRLGPSELDQGFPCKKCGQLYKNHGGLVSREIKGKIKFLYLNKKTLEIELR